MAISQLTLYNNALLMLGQRSLASLTEAREPRYALDEAYGLDAVDYCLELVRPRFAVRTTKLTASSATTQHDLDKVFSLPSDYLATVGLYSDAELTQEITRYIIEGSTVACDYATVYLRHVYSNATFSSWSPSFAQVVAAYLASRVAVKIDPTKLEAVTKLFTEYVTVARDIEEEKEPSERAPQTSGTLSAVWRHIYNDALLILSQPKLTTGTEDTFARAHLDSSVDAGVVEDVMEETGWTFALTTDHIYYDPSAEPAFGYKYAHAKPTALHRLHGIYEDEYTRVPVRLYMDEEQYWFCDLTEIYVQYVSTDWLTTPNTWPTFFKRLVAARMAWDVAPMLKGADSKLAKEVFERRRSEALSNDALSAPPKIFRQGEWTGSRFRGKGLRGRP